MLLNQLVNLNTYAMHTDIVSLPKTHTYNFVHWRTSFIPFDPFVVTLIPFLCVSVDRAACVICFDNFIHIQNLTVALSKS